MPRPTHLECTRCSQHFPADRPQTVCPKDGGILYARYDLATIRKTFSLSSLLPLAPTMWRYDAVLPEASPVTLGEGFTPMQRSREYPGVFIKDEGLNPTGSFKARGLSAAVTMARHFGLKKLAIPSAGNAAGALAAYAELKDKPAWTAEGWFDVSTTKEPYRVEGKKTMGYEIAEQLGWKLPQGVIYPTGGGVGLLGMWKAFEEMEELGFIGSERPNMISVQASGCAPVVKAWDEGRASVEMWPNASTVAAGLRVPKPYGDYLILDILKKSGGLALAATDSEIFAATRQWAKVEGIFAAPEGAASLVAYQKLLASGFFTPDDTVVLFNTGSGLKYLDVLDTSSVAPSPGSRAIAGIIGPY